MSNVIKKQTDNSSNNPNDKPDLPKVNIDILENYPICYSEYKLPPNYVKYNEKTLDELDEEVEYDMDEEDNVWLKLINQQREKDPEIQNKELISQEQFELLMDRLEKESYFQQATSNISPKKSDLNSSLNTSRLHNDSTSEDALCCICLDGECVNSNVILFCDMCNLAVHQECYGVPYIPEGQWLCRKCIQSPSAPVSCILCPNKYGAFKQTDRGEWAHVVCAIWIPEVHFANTVFLEPIIGTENIDRARWKLMCIICRKRNVGACIQCDKANCYTAFHVTCAQQAGLYMNIQEEYVEQETRGRKKKNPKNADSSSSTIAEVRKCAYCDIHTPLETLSPKTRKTISKSGSSLNNAECKEALKQAQKARMKKARKILAEQRKAPPVICFPVISKEKIQDITNRVDIDHKEKFMEKLVNYWLLKRYSRNGVPILRRLQNTASLRKNQKSENYQEPKEKKKISENENDLAKRLELKEKLACWKKLRQDLEKARLLMELIRKRERLKRELVRIDQIQSLYELNPFNGVFLQRILDLLIDFDKNFIFTQPVDPVEVPSYYECIKEPMDFSKMQTKIDNLEYNSFDQFESDFNLIISNCLTFNPKNTYYYKQAIKLKDQASSLIKQAKKMCESIGSANEFIQLVIENSKLNNALIEIENLNNKAQEIESNKKEQVAKTPNPKRLKAESQKLPNRKSLRLNKDLSLLEEETKEIRDEEKSQEIEAKEEEQVQETPSKRISRSNAKSMDFKPIELIDTPKKLKITNKKNDEKKEYTNEQEAEAEQKLETSESSSSTTGGVNRRTAVLFKRNKSNKNLKKDDSVSDTSISENNNNLMNVSGSSNQTSDSNTQ